MIETSGAILYVAPNGNDASEGTLNNPLATLNEAVNRMDAGDTCILEVDIVNLLVCPIKII